MRTRQAGEPDAPDPPKESVVQTGTCAQATSGCATWHPETRGSDVYKCFAGTVSLQIGQLREMRLLKKGQEIDVAIDMHLIPRYDKRYGAELVRSKAKDGTHVFERYITIQCIDQNRRLVLGVLDMPSLEDTADFVRKIIGIAQDAGACIGMAMLDREFFTAGVMGTLGDMGIKYHGAVQEHRSGGGCHRRVCGRQTQSGL